MLSERQWPFTIFVAPKLVGLNRQYLSWDQLKEMQAGGATIANHSLGHEHLIRLEPGENEADWLARIKANTLAAERVLTEQLGVRPKLYALPYGEYRPSLVQQFHEMGYTVFGQQSGATRDRFSSHRSPAFSHGRALQPPWATAGQNKRASFPQ